MMKKISRKLFVSRHDKEMGRQYLSLADYWMDLSERTENENLKIHYMSTSAIYLNKAVAYLGFKTAEDMHAYFKQKGNVTDKLKIAIEAMGEGEYRLKLDDEFIEFYSGIHEELSKRVKSYEIKDASERKEVQLNKALLDSKEFINLWNKINSKTIYRLEF